MEENKNFGSFYYLNSAATLLSYSSQNERSFAHNFHFMLPNFVMYTGYFDSCFNSIFNQIQDNDLLDVTDLLSKKKQESNAAEQKLDIAKNFDHKNLKRKYDYLVEKIFSESLYKQDYCSEKLRENYFNNESRDALRPLYSDILIFKALMEAMVADRNAIAHPKRQFIPKNLAEGVPDVFPETAKVFGLECYNFGKKNLEVLKAIHKKLSNFERFFEIGMNYLYAKKNGNTSVGIFNPNPPKSENSPS